MIFWVGENWKSTRKQNPKKTTGTKYELTDGEDENYDTIGGRV
jgi:hypothetical protein